MSEEIEYTLTDTPIGLNGISFISFGEKDGIYQIDTYAGAGEYAGQYYVAEKDLANVLSPSLAEYIKQASRLTEPIGAYDSYGSEDNDWEYGYHYVPIQREFNAPQEYAQELNRIAGRNNMIVPTRINDVELTPEQQNALRLGELVVVKNVSKGDEKKTLAVKLDSEKGFQKMEVPFFMENAPLSEIKELWNVNARFNEQLSAFEKRELSGNLVLGKPFDLLKTCGLQESEIFVKQKVLGRQLFKHR